MTLREKAGADSARMLAAVGVFVLGERLGDDARRRFFAAKYGPARPEDARGWLGDILHPARPRGIDENAFLAAWRAALQP